MLVDDGEDITAGGASTVYLLVIYLVQRFAGPRAAVRAAREFLVDTGRPPEDAYLDTSIYRGHSDPVVERVQAHVVKNLRAPHSLASLARRGGVSVKTLTRRFRAATGISPLGFVQAARVEAAKTMLATSDDGFDTVTEAVGYDDPRAFRRLFKRIADLTPRTFRRTFALPPLGR